ncbi:MAG: hybrid sensor histidine kinase/response regulator [Kofleriaceae bacterium]
MEDRRDDLVAENRALRQRIAELESEVNDDRLARALIDHSPHFMSLIAPDGTVLATRLASGTVLGRSVYEFVDPGQAGILRDALARACATRVPVTYEISGMALGPTGQLEPGHAYVSRAIPVLERGEVTALIIVPTDVSELKRLRAQVERAERVESIGHLTAGIAHNFNNLLAAILPNLDYAMTASEDRRRIALAAAREATIQARNLVKSLLALAQRQPARHELADPAEVVERVERICALAFPRDIVLTRSLAGDAGWVGISATTLEQVLLNLLVNARDAFEHAATPDPRIDVAIDRVVEAGRATVRLRVTDNGPGMTDEVRRRVFEPFFTTKAHRGTGLGLANAHARVREVGGELECTSAPGAGTTFAISLPELPRPDIVAAAPPVLPGPGSGETILMIDDEPLLRSAMRRVLESDGYVVIEADSPRAARDLLAARGDIQLILLDHSMPGESGVAAIPSLRERTTAPVVLFTGLASGVPAGVAAVLEKPASPSEIQRVLRDVLDRRRTRATG